MKNFADMCIINDKSDKAKSFKRETDEKNTYTEQSL